MNVECEKKYILSRMPSAPWNSRVNIVQVYLHIGKYTETRVRLEGQKCFLTTKNLALESRLETSPVEYSIQAFGMLLLENLPNLMKTRYMYPMGDQLLEVDVYEGILKGLIILETEFKTLDEYEHYEPPVFCDVIADVTTNSAYKNRNLAVNQTWPLKGK